MGSLNLLEKMKTIISSFDWLDCLYLGIAFVLLCILVFLIYRRKYNTDVKKPIVPELTVPNKVILPVNSLTNIWNRFVSKVPLRLRSKALSAPFSIVIGDFGCGKSSIIDQYADWQGQNFRFYPSLVEDPLLQIYLGAKSLVIEFGSSFIFDTTTSAFLALKKLWGHLPPNPQIVMVIDATSLMTPKTDELRQLGYALFGKLKVFEDLEKKSLPVVLVLSNMDKITGFLEFANFLKESGISMQLNFPTNNTVEKLEFCLNDFQVHLNRALITQSSQNYLKIVEFLNEAPGLFRVLIDFFKVVGLEKNYETPYIIRLCLLSNQLHSFGCSPFVLSVEEIEQKKSLNINNHAKIAMALSLISLIYLIGSYNYQLKMVTEVRKNINNIDTIPIQYYTEKVSPLFLDFTFNLNKNVFLSFMPNFFINIEKENNYLLILKIRKNYLFPLLEQIQNEPNAIFKNSRFIGLLYSTKNNEIGKILAKNPTKNPIDYVLYGNLLQDYLTYNTHTEELDVILNSMDIVKDQNYLNDYTTWILLFRNFEKFLKVNYIDEKDFKILQEKIALLLETIDILDYYVDYDEINKWLINNTTVRLFSKNESALRQKEIFELLSYVKSLKIDKYENCSTSSSLQECFEMIKTILSYEKTDKSKSVIEFNLGNEYFLFDVVQFDNLIIHSKIRMMLRDFINNHRNYDGSIFFNPSLISNDLDINYFKNSGIPLTSSGHVDRRFTYTSFEKYVKPAVIDLTDVVEKLPIDNNEKQLFKEFVLKNFDTYSDEYVKSYLNYFKQFQIKIDSVWGINYVIDDLQKSNSQLQDMLVEIKTQSKLNIPDNSNFQSFSQKLSVFRVIQQLMEEKNGVYPKFQKYQSMMLHMQNEINSQDDYIPKKTEDHGDLKSALPAIGRLAWSINMNEDGSYFNLMKSWLESEGINEEWRQPFLAPVQKVKEFGTIEINQMINYIWSDIWDSNILPLLNKFPFSSNASSDNELTIENLTKILHPKQGEFWNTFNRYLAPMYQLNNGVWIRRRELNKSVILPLNSIERINAIGHLTNNLWDSQGNPKPLELFVKPGLLPTYDSQQMPNAPLVALSYLRKGSSAILGFNQQTEWQKLNFEWWKIEPAIVGVEFRKDDDLVRAYADINIADSNWNLFRLLKQGHLAGEQRYYWSVVHPNFPKEPLNIEFSFQSNPLAFFYNLSGS